MKTMLAIASVGLIVVLPSYGALGRRVRRHNRAKFAAHPEKRPYGKRLLLRALPFKVLVAAIAAVQFSQHRYVAGTVGLVIVGLFAYDVWRRCNPRSTPPA